MGRLFKKYCPVSNCFTLLFQNCIESRSRRSILLFSIEMGRWVWKWKATNVLWHLSAPFYCSWIAHSHSLTLKMVSIPHWQIFMKLLPLKEKAILINRCIFRVLKFGLSEKHTKFEKICLMVLTNQLIYYRVRYSLNFDLKIRSGQGC